MSCETEGDSGDGCDLASTLCKYDLRKVDLFVLSWARVRLVRRVSISSELLMCGGGVRSILLLPLVARCLETIDVCSESILNQRKLNRLYQCQSKILFITILWHCLTTYPGSVRTFTTYPGWDALLRHTRITIDVCIWRMFFCPL